MSTPIPTPRADAATHDDWSGGEPATEPEVARQLEIELVKTRSTMQRKLNATKGREVILRDALSHISRINSPHVDDQGEVVKRLKRAVNVAKNALSVEPPDVVAVEDVKPLLDALKNSEHARDCDWHTALMHPPGPCTCGRDEAIATFTAKYPTL